MKVSVGVLTLALLTLGGFAGTAVAQSPLPGTAGVPKSDSAGLSAPTEAALRAAASANLFEIESSRLALSRTQSAKVKEFAERMMADHGRAANRAKQVLTEIGATSPPVMLEAKEQQRMDRLKAAPNAGFDQAYAAAQVEAHQEAIAMLTDYSRSGDNPQLKALAAQLLPTMQAHLDQARALP